MLCTSRVRERKKEGKLEVVVCQTLVFTFWPRVCQWPLPATCWRVCRALRHILLSLTSCLCHLRSACQGGRGRVCAYCHALSQQRSLVFLQLHVFCFCCCMKSHTSPSFLSRQYLASRHDGRSDPPVIITWTVLWPKPMFTLLCLYDLTNKIGYRSVKSSLAPTFRHDTRFVAVTSSHLHHEQVVRRLTGRSSRAFLSNRPDSPSIWALLLNCHNIMWMCVSNVHIDFM